MGFAAPKLQEESHGFLFEADRPKQIAKRPAPYMFRKFKKSVSNVLPFFSSIRTHMTSKTDKKQQKKLIFRKKTRPFHHFIPANATLEIDISHMFAQEPKGVWIRARDVCAASLEQWCWALPFIQCCNIWG